MRREPYGLRGRAVAAYYAFWRKVQRKPPPFDRLFDEDQDRWIEAVRYAEDVIEASPREVPLVAAVRYG